ncbi:LysR family transcriptional regulator [Nocardiopsis sp. RSe5-2]|uniref:LysR family transcriptional regulator n=1 Tax=Nocardiopsis endophytica TaxID=3018445 RepID=A0ABT4UD28_9ACTN|nr:LysR family transcriptional regulator [Nocardiopsis endophytica]MDA2814212.1 LysR family transcriptional regulator [Nocardiopsis endophytica]
MLIRQLEYLAALDRERHFARAASACHVSQPALSAALRKLEAELDIRIVRRGHRFEGFTPEGERVLRWAYRILAERDLLDAEVGAMRKGRTGRLRIGVLPSAAAAVAHLTAPFGTRHPRVRLSVRALPAEDIARGLADGSLDCGVAHLGATPGRSLGSAVRLYGERGVVLACPGRFTGRASVAWEELAGVPLCGLTCDGGALRAMEAALAEHGGRPSVQVETDALPALYTHVAEGDWCGVVAHSWLCSAPPPPGVRVLPVAGAERVREVGIVVPERAPEPVLAREFAAFARTVPLQEVLDAALPPGPGAPMHAAPGGYEPRAPRGHQASADSASGAEVGPAAGVRSRRSSSPA